MTSSLGRVWWRNGGPSIPPSRSPCSPHEGSEAHTYSREECSPHMGLGRASQPALDSCLWFLPMQTLGGTADGLSSWAPVTHAGHLACIPDFHLPQGKHLGSAPADGGHLEKREEPNTSVKQARLKSWLHLFAMWPELHCLGLTRKCAFQ